jgi:hypothetical protein
MSDDRQVLDRIAAIQALVSGVAKAFADAPHNLKDGELPAFVNIYSEQPSTNQRADAGRLRKIARYEMNLYVKKASQGIEYEAQQMIVPLVKLVENEFFARQMLQLDDQGLGGVESAEITGVKVGQLAYGAVLYTGATFFLEAVYTRLVPQR